MSRFAEQLRIARPEVYDIENSPAYRRHYQQIRRSKTMQVRATHQAPKTIKQAKADFKKYGPRISSQQVRIDEREGELYRRAEKIRENEKKRKLAKQRKQEREDREREAGRRLNIASQKPTIPRSQFSLSGFVKTVKPVVCESAIKQTDLIEEEPWSDDELDDDDLDDKSLLIAAAPVEDATETIAGKSLSPAPTVQAHLPSSSFDMDLDSSWEGCFESNTQIERDMSIENGEETVPAAPPVTDPTLFMISTQDLSFSSDDLNELDMQTITVQAEIDLRASRNAQDKVLMPPPRLPPQKSATLANSSCRIADTDPFLDDFPLSTQDFHGIAC